MLHRNVEPELAEAAKEYSIVSVLGPRQSGKTTVVRKSFPQKVYYNLEQPDIRQFVAEDPVGILNQHPEGIIFDEVQRLPELLSYLQARVDEVKEKDLYILTGSHQSELQAAISIKLCAGRVGSIVNTNALANELGVSRHTVKYWLSIMQATFVIVLLPPYYENFGKRAIKSPKLYFSDVGLAAYLLDIEKPQQLQRERLRGAVI
ncbi:MAG: ATP-binding protein [Gammaproteobacteria bacterium]